MKYQIQQTGWPVGQHLIPVYTVIDDVAGEDDWSKLVRANKASPPPNAHVLDDAAYATLNRAQKAARGEAVEPEMIRTKALPVSPQPTKKETDR